MMSHDDLKWILRQWLYGCDDSSDIIPVWNHPKSLSRHQNKNFRLLLLVSHAENNLSKQSDFFYICLLYLCMYVYPYMYTQILCTCSVWYTHTASPTTLAMNSVLFSVHTTLLSLVSGWKLQQIFLIVSVFEWAVLANTHICTFCQTYVTFDILHA